ncbi:hypothetical protein [Caldibacillus debilis]|nr:hypothetical protein [Caldibacillus debilis]
MEYQEYPDIQTIEKIAWKEMAGIFSTIMKRKRISPHHYIHCTFSVFC